jgi:DNA-binding NarL/FixJ family response regulator
MTGLTDEAVAAHLGTSLRTVQRRVRHLMDLTGGRTRLQLGFQVARRGWLG